MQFSFNNKKLNDVMQQKKEREALENREAEEEKELQEVDTGGNSYTGRTHTHTHTQICSCIFIKERNMTINKPSTACLLSLSPACQEDERACWRQQRCLHLDIHSPRCEEQTL